MPISLSLYKKIRENKENIIKNYYYYENKDNNINKLSK